MNDKELLLTEIKDILQQRLHYVLTHRTINDFAKQIREAVESHYEPLIKQAREELELFTDLLPSGKQCWECPLLCFPNNVPVCRIWGEYKDYIPAENIIEKHEQCPYKEKTNEADK